MRRCDLFEVALEVADALLDQPAVDFELLFARAAHADAHLDARQVRPHPLQPRQRVLELRELHRQAGFVRLRAAGEDVEDQLGAVEHLDAEGLLQIASLAGRKIVVEDHHVGVGGVDQMLQLLDFAVAQIGGGVGRLPPLQDAPHY